MSSLEQEHNARRGVGVGIFPIEFERPFNVGARLGNPGGDDRDDSSRVSHFMNKFCKLDYIKYNVKLQIHHSLLNVVLYDTPQTDD